MVPMRDIGSDNGIPQKKMVESLEWHFIKHFASVGEKTEAGVNGYESGGQEGKTVMRGGENQLGVKLASLMESEATLEKSVEGIDESFIVGEEEWVCLD